MPKTANYTTHRERTIRDTPAPVKAKTTATAHLNLSTHSLGKLYAGYVMQTQKRQLNTAEAIDELSMAGAKNIMPHDLLQSSGFELEPA